MTDVFSRILEKHTLRKCELVENAQLKLVSIKKLKYECENYTQNLWNTFRSFVAAKDFFVLVKLLQNLNGITRYGKEGIR